MKRTILLAPLTKGSYKLTKNLTTTGSCLTVVNNFVSIDLNGFAITGDGGSGDFGIKTEAVATLTGIEIRNGTITNFGVAIYLPSAASGVVVERVRAVRNSGHGIFVGDNCVLKDNVAAENGGTGLIGASGCVASGNTASQNANTGIVVALGSTVANNNSYSNGNFGIFVSCPSNTVGNTATGNGGNEIALVGSGCGNNHNVAL